MNASQQHRHAGRILERDLECDLERNHERNHESNHERPVETRLVPSRPVMSPVPAPPGS